MLFRSQEGLNTINAALAGNEAAADLQKAGIELKTYKDIPKAVAALEKNLVDLKTGIATVESGIAQVQQGKVSVSDALEQLNRNEILNSIEISSNLAQLSSGEASLEEAQTKLEDSKGSAMESADLNQVLSMDTINNLLRAQNFSMPAGYITDDKTEYLVKIGDELSDMGELSDMILIDMHLDGIEPIRLCDIADISMTDNASEVYAKVNGNPGIMLTLEKQTGYSTGNVTKALHKRFESLMNDDENLHLAVLMDQGVYIDLKIGRAHV